MTKLVYRDASRKVSVGLYTFVASYFVVFDRATRPGCQVTSVVHTKETLLLQGIVQTTESGMK